MKRRSIRITTVVGLLLLFFPQVGFSQKDKTKAKGEYKTSIRLLDTQGVTKVAVNFDIKTWGAELKQALDVLKREVNVFESEDQAIAVRFTVFPDKDHKVELFGRPALDANEKKQFLKVLDGVKIARSHLITMRVQMEFKRGKPPEIKPGESWPASSAPAHVLRRAAFDQASVKGKVEILQHWARSEVLPVLGAYQRQAAAEYAGVVGLGNLLEKTDFSKPIDVEQLVDRNSDYWRGTLEMSRGNPLVTATRVFMEVANGNFDQAARFGGLHQPFLDKGAEASQFIAEFLNLHQQLYDDLTPKVLAATRDFDAGAYPSAIAKCEAILQEHPRHAWARYELWYSQHTMDKNSDAAAKPQPWKEVADEIYAMDSMYPMAVTATNEEEGFAVYSRMKLKRLKRPKDKDQFRDYVIEQADLAFDLEVYPFAAEAYWLILSNFPKESYGNRDLREFVGYAMDRAGGKQVIGQLGLNPDKVAIAPEAQRKKRFESNPLFGKFAKKANAKNSEPEKAADAKDNTR